MSPSVERHDELRMAEGTGYQRRRRIIRDVGIERRQLISKVTRFIWLLFTVLESLIGLRVLLKLIAADPNNPFASLVYRVTEPFLLPFFGLTETLSAQGIVLEVTSIIAMLVYALLGWLIVRLIWLIFYRPSAVVVSTYEKRNIR